MQPAALSDSPSVEPTDPPLLRRIQAGDPDALDAVYRRHTPDLLGLAERLCGSRADAEDVVHDVFVGLPEALSKYEERGKFSAWLRRLTVRRALTQVRQRQRENVPSLFARVSPRVWFEPLVWEHTKPVNRCLAFH